MGGADKGLVAYGGRPLIEWMLEALRPQADRVLISANRNLDVYGAYGHRVVSDTLPGFQGPLAGVLAALETVDAPWLAVVPCDTPHVPVDLLARLLDAAKQANVPLAVAADPERTHHTCFVVQSTQRAALAQFLQGGERAVRRWMTGVPHVTVCFDAAAFANINALQDLPVAR